MYKPENVGRVLGQEKHKISYSVQSDQAYIIQDYQSEVCPPCNCIFEDNILRSSKRSLFSRKTEKAQISTMNVKFKKMCICQNKLDSNILSFKCENDSIKAQKTTSKLLKNIVQISKYIRK